MVYSCSPLPHSLYPAEETEICLFTKNDKKTTKELLVAKKVKGVAKVMLQTPPISGGLARWRRKGGRGEEGGGRGGGREAEERGGGGGPRKRGGGDIHSVTTMLNDRICIWVNSLHFRLRSFINVI